MKIKSAVLVLLLISFMGCSGRFLKDGTLLCRDMVFPSRYIFLVRGRLKDAETRQRFEAMVYGLDGKIRIDIINTLGFTEFTMIYRDEKLYIEDRREGKRELFVKGRDSYLFLGADIFSVHPGFFFTGYDVNIKSAYPRKLFHSICDCGELYMPVYDGQDKSYSIIRRIQGREILYKAWNPEKIGDCLFFRDRRIRLEDRILEYTVESYSINIDIQEDLFSWR